MTDAKKLADAVSALRVQRDAAHKERDRLGTQNRVLLRHQRDVRAWLADAIQKWEDAQGTDQVLEVAAEIHRTAKQLHAEAERLSAQ